MRTVEAYTFGPQGWGDYVVGFRAGQLPTYSALGAPADHILVPGLVDVHIHGAHGIDVMSASRAEILDLATLLVELGYEFWLPTTITSSLEATADVISRLPSHPSIFGFHLEGPFLSPEYPGAQPAEAIIAPSPAWDLVVDHPGLKLITLAPEIPGCLDLVRRLSARGVIVSLGHTNCTYAQASAARLAGLSHATHTFNAMRPFHHREAGAVGYILTDDQLYAEIIYDRIHVVPDAAKLLFQSKPEDKVVGVSDGSLASGLAPGTHLQMWGHECVVGNREVRLASNGSLAGSAVTLRDVFINLAEDFGVEVATRCCSMNPRQELGLTSPPKTYILMDRQFQSWVSISC